MNIDLSTLDEVYDSTSTEDVFQLIPDGDWQAEIVDTKIIQTKTKNEPMLVLKLRIIGDNHYHGKYLPPKTFLLAEGESLKYVKADLETLKYTGKISELPERHSKFIGLKLLVTKKTNGSWENIYIKEVFTAMEEKDAFDFGT